METGLLTTDQIRSWVIPLLEKYDMCSASLFGSYARDEADASSDIDILLVGNRVSGPSMCLAWQRIFIGFRAKSRCVRSSLNSMPALSATLF